MSSNDDFITPSNADDSEPCANDENIWKDSIVLPFFSSLSILCYCYLLWMYFVLKSPILKRHPTTLAIYRCIFELFFLHQYLWVSSMKKKHFYDDDHDDPPYHCDSSDFAWYLSFASQVGLVGSELWFLAISMDLRSAYTNPFSSYKQNQAWYATMVIAISVISALLLIGMGPKVYGVSNLGLVWIQSRRLDHSINYPKFVLYYDIATFAFIYSVWANFRFNRDNERGFSKTVSNRLSIMQRSRDFTMGYVGYGCVVYFFEIISFIRGFGPNSQLGINTVPAYLLSLRGVWGLAVILYSNRSDLSWDLLNPFRLNLKQSIVENVALERLTLEPHLNIALRSEILYFTTQGIMFACREFDRQAALRKAARESRHRSLRGEGYDVEGYGSQANLDDDDYGGGCSGGNTGDDGVRAQQTSRQTGPSDDQPRLYSFDEGCACRASTRFEGMTANPMLVTRQSESVLPSPTSRVTSGRYGSGKSSSPSKGVAFAAGADGNDNFYGDGDFGGNPRTRSSESELAAVQLQTMRSKHRSGGGVSGPLDVNRNMDEVVAKLQRVNMQQDAAVNKAMEIALQEEVEQLGYGRSSYSHPYKKAVSASGSASGSNTNSDVRAAAYASGAARPPGSMRLRPLSSSAHSSARFSGRFTAAGAGAADEGTERERDTLALMSREATFVTGTPTQQAQSGVLNHVPPAYTRSRVPVDSLRHSASPLAVSSQVQEPQERDSDFDGGKSATASAAPGHTAVRGPLSTVPPSVTSGGRKPRDGPADAVGDDWDDRSSVLMRESSLDVEFGMRGSSSNEDGLDRGTGVSATFTGPGGRVQVPPRLWRRISKTKPPPSGLGSGSGSGLGSRSQSVDSTQGQGQGDEEQQLQRTTSTSAKAAETLSRAVQSVIDNASSAASMLFSAVQKDFRFKDFSPKLFARMRELCHIKTEDYAKSFETTCKEKFSEGRSGAFMFYSSDQQCIVKTTTKEESQALQRVLPHFVDYLEENPNSLVVRFLGSHCITMYGNELYFVVMLNVFPTFALSERYDLKGSWVNRHGNTGSKRTRREQMKKSVSNFSPLYQDNDLQHQISLEPDVAALLASQIQRDVIFLRSRNIMDYSLLIGVRRERFRVLGSAAEIKTSLQSMDDDDVLVSPVINRDRLSDGADGADGAADDKGASDGGSNHTSLQVLLQRCKSVSRAGTQSKLGKDGGMDGGDKDIEEGGALRSSRISNNGFSTAGGTGAGADAGVGVTEEEDAFRRDADGGMRALFVEGPGTYYMGIIDVLQEWNLKKRLERWAKIYLKGVDAEGLSAIGPMSYSERFWRRCVLDAFEGLEDDDRDLIDWKVDMEMEAHVRADVIHVERGMQEQHQQDKLDQESRQEQDERVLPLHELAHGQQPQEQAQSRPPPPPPPAPRPDGD